MSADAFVWVIVFYVTKVVYKSIFYTKHSLTYILFVAFVACDAIDQIRAST